MIAWGLLSLGIVLCVVGIAFITTNHDLRATVSFIVGVLAVIGGRILLTRSRNPAS
jgi:uncharacterized membrane protein HdeD (DUF308 family)